MNFKWHFIVAIIFFIALMLIFRVITISLILIPILCGVLIPDADLKFNSHRHILLHSITIPVFVLLFNWSLLTILITLSFGLHLICDISIKKKGGFFTIKYFAQKSIGGFWFTEVWLILNFIVSLIIFTIYMVCFV